MIVKKTLAVAGMLALMGGMTACGGGGGSKGGNSADGPTNASKDAFCGVLTNLDSSATPAGLAAAFIKVGTPSDIDAASRPGYEVLIEHLSKLSDSTNASDLTAREAGLSTADKADVLAFTSYLTKECVPGGLRSSPSS